jgi:AcrR family transcriptional regulator
MSGQQTFAAPGAGAVPEALMGATLACCGEVGYQKLSTGMIALRYGGSRSNFYRYFEGKAACFEAAYAWKANQLAGRLLAPSASGGRDLHAALLTLADFMAEDPLVARAILGEALGAGGAVLKTRSEIVLRLASALDAGLRQGADAPPALTGEFVVSAIEQLAFRALTKDGPAAFRSETKGLAALVHRLYGLTQDA